MVVQGGADMAKLAPMLSRVLVSKLQPLQRVPHPQHSSSPLLAQ